MKNKKYISWILALSVLLVKDVFAEVSFYEATIYRPLSFGFLRDVHLWILFATIILTFCIFYVATSRLPLFRDQQRIGIIFSLVLAFITSLATPAPNWVMFIAGYGGWIILVLALLMGLFAGYSMIHKGTVHVAGELREAHEDFMVGRKYYKREKKLEREEIEKVEDIISSLESMPHSEDEDYQGEKKKILSDINDVKTEMLRNIRFDKKRNRISGKSFRSWRILKTDKKIEDCFGNAYSSLEKDNVEKSVKECKSALKLLGKVTKLNRKWWKGSKQKLDETEETIDDETKEAEVSENKADQIRINQGDRGQRLAIIKKYSKIVKELRDSRPDNKVWKKKMSGLYIDFSKDMDAAEINSKEYDDDFKEL